MPTRYEAARTIAAPPERVWALLVDAAAYPAWNPTVRSVEGRIAAGERIRIVSAANPRRTFTVEVTTADAPRRLVFTGRMPLGLFTAPRTVTLDPAADGGTAMRVVEVFTGPLAPLLGRLIPDLTAITEEFADALKAAAERP